MIRSKKRMPTLSIFILHCTEGSSKGRYTIKNKKKKVPRLEKKKFKLFLLSVDMIL